PERRGGLDDHPPRPLRDPGRAAPHGGDVPRHGLAARVVTSRPLPLWLAGAVVAGTFALLLWLEGRRPLRPTVEPKGRRLARNLAVVALSTAAVALTERPAIGALSGLVAARRWGLLQWAPLPPRSRCRSPSSSWTTRSTSGTSSPTASPGSGASIWCTTSTGTSTRRRRCAFISQRSRSRSPGARPRCS